MSELTFREAAESELMQSGNSIESRIAFLEKFYSDGPVPPPEEGTKTHVVVFRIDIGDLNPDDGISYVKRVRRNLGDKFPLWEIYFVPTRELSSITILNLTTMRWVKL